MTGTPIAILISAAVIAIVASDWRTRRELRKLRRDLAAMQQPAPVIRHEHASPDLDSAEFQQWLHKQARINGGWQP